MNLTRLIRIQKKETNIEKQNRETVKITVDNTQMIDSFAKTIEKMKKHTSKYIKSGAGS